MSIRIAKESDLPQILSIYGPYVENTTVSFEYEVPSLEVFRARFASVTAHFPWLVWEEDGRVLGYAYACAPFERAAYSWCAEPSIYLHPDAQGKGIGKKLYAQLEQLLTAQGYQLSYAIITSENEASLKFHQAMGYRILARFPNCGFKHGRWLGVIWMEKRLSPVEMPSNFPETFSSIVKNNRNDAAFLGNMTLS